MSIEHAPLFDGYTMARLEAEDFDPVFEQNWPRLFESIVDYRVSDLLSDDERNAGQTLAALMADRRRIRIGLFHAGVMIGWSLGVQATSDRFEMVNSALFPEHRGRGVYSAMLPKLLEIVRAEGFQIVASRHQATNNAVIVPKLKAGFVISGMEISDAFGVLVHLSYFFHPTRRKVMDYRVGHVRPDDELRALLDV